MIGSYLWRLLFPGVIHLVMAIMMCAVMFTIGVLLWVPSTTALQNGAAITPPMGWLSWQRYRCAIACADATSKDCFNERLIKDTADAMVSMGYKEAGYEYVCLDDCWQAPRRINGHVVPDPKRFPSGIKGLADYVHSKGLKLGLLSLVFFKQILKKERCTS